MCVFEIRRFLPERVLLSLRRGSTLDSRPVEHTFGHLRKRLGWVGRGSYSFPRILDMRHSFICRRLVSWYKECANVDNAILALATYVGHTEITASIGTSLISPI